MDSRVEAIAQSYVSRAQGNPSLALREAIADAMADLCEAERRIGQRDRLISRGYARGVYDEVPGEAPPAAVDAAERLLGGYGR